MRLYSKPTSPYARKVRVVAAETGLGGRLSVEDPPLRDTSTEFWRINPTGMIPALITDENELVVESNIICEYLDSLHKGARLFPKEGEARWRALKLNALADVVIGALISRVRESWRDESQQDPKLIELEKTRVANVLGALEGDPMISDPMNIGHITLACALSVSDRRFPNEDWRTAHPQLAAWYEVFGSRTSMLSTYAE